jgi:DNA-binding transcriptional LysR family regulator
MKAVEFGDAMLGFSPGPADYSRFDTEDLFEVEVVLVGSLTDPLARRRRASAAELRHRPIAFADRSRAAIERELRAASIEIDPNLVEVYPDTERAKKAAESGVALAFVVRDAALRELQHRYLVEISVANLEIRRPFEAMWLKGRRLDRFAEAFLRIARERGRQDRTRFRR